MLRKPSDKRPWYKEPWPWILMAGPAIVIIAGAITVLLAIQSNDGLVADDYYKQGLAINQQMQRDRNAESLGLRADLMRSGLQVRLMVTGSAEVKLPEKLILRVTHPTRAGMDQLVSLTAEGPGMFGGKLDKELFGRWLVLLEDPEGQWRLHGDWQADSAESLRLTPEEPAKPVRGFVSK